MLVSLHKLKFVLMLVILMTSSIFLTAQVWTLEQCIEQAKVHNITLQIVDNNILISKEKQREAKANLLPKINLGADYKYFTNLPYQLLPLSVFGGAEGEFKEAQFGVPHNINAHLQIGMPIYNSTVSGAIKTSKIASELSTLQGQKSEEDLVYQISNLYFNAQILRNQIAFVDTNLANANRLLGNAILLREQQLITGVDVDKITLQVRQLEAKQKVVESNYAQVLNTLKFMIDIPLDQSFEVDGNIEFNETGGYPNESNIDLQLAEVQHRLITSQKRTLINSRIPSISLFGQYGYTGYGYDEEPNSFLNFYQVGFVGLQLNYQIFNGTVTSKKIAQKELELANNRLQQDLISKKSQMEVENALLQKGAAQINIEAARFQLELADSIYKQSVAQQQQGVGTLSDILLADNELHEAQSNYLSQVIMHMQADLELIKLSGNISK